MKSISMNLPNDPRERRRITISIIQQRFRNHAHGIQHRSIIRDHDDEDDDDDDDDDRDHDIRYSKDMLARTEDPALRLLADNHPISRQWGSQHNSQHTKQLKTSNLARNNNNGKAGHSLIGPARGNNRAKFLPRVANRANKVGPLSSVNDDDLVDAVKRRLSLPSDTPIADDILQKINENLTNSLNDRRAQPLSRIARRQSLLEIGFGKLSTYTKLHALGAGTYSIVYKGSSRLTHRLVALKVIHLEREEGVPFTAIREISLLKQLKHNNIITLHDLIYSERTLTLVFEFVDRDLSHYMNECDHKINLNNVRLFLFQLLRGLKFCHDRKILHRDLKPQNILISAIGELKLADFGLARARTFPTNTYTDEVVTLWYRPPDILLGNVNYGTDIDMWGVGCIFFEMVAGFTLFLGVDNKKQIACIFEILGTPSESEWPNIEQDLEYCAIDIPHYQGRELASVASRLEEPGVDLLKRFLRCNPNLRISSDEALHHEYFDTLPAEVYDLHDSVSIFSLPSVRLAYEDYASNPSALHNVHI